MSTYKKLKYPPVVFWELTDKCNHNCIHCFNYWRTDTDNTLSEKSYEEYNRIADKILDQKPALVVLTGGEPLIVFKKIKPIIEKFISNSATVSINTNAALITPEMADFFEKNRVSLFVSFPCFEEDVFDRVVDTKGAFSKVIEALNIIKAHNIVVNFNMVVSTVNLGYIFETAKFLKDLSNIKSISITRVSVPINARECFDEYLLSKTELNRFVAECVKVEKELNMEVFTSSPITPCSLDGKDAFDLFAFKGNCEAGKTSYVISATNTVRACARDSKEYGNFLDEPFDEIFERMNEWRDETFVPKECKGCKHVERCRGGCRMDSAVKDLHRCGLDNYSVPEELNNTYELPQRLFPTWDYLTEFFVPNKLAFVEETFATRVSFCGTYMYVTKSFADYLKDNLGNVVSLANFCKQFNLDIDEAVKIITNAVDCGIIRIKNMEVL